MCQATIYRKGNGDEEILREVISLEQTDEGWVAQTFFEDPMRIKGRIKSIDFLKHTVTFIQEDS